ncbi:uncharacterized protein involved in tolerance to divalent cations [Desulfocapsa sulfexigens DSM 10523]|uniref:Uncharacterized protein involved in tolerance to divalent cations n=1 Tax=Desulfocapsa sulfexigens (strain DSM 10523 / SB164P1) TaxID=1167006 RepID=M1NIH4_DESSD|nr:divalent-cation tolerance protein CutA [Desulfocapsa sulfexigens]AGF79369.1 uncharacterized protein involved in tolerance to divalent cations [Desulfocapsa sulfexigens DSM 10523]
MSDPILVLTTFEEKEEALQLARILLEKRLVACAQIDSPVDSLYWWNGVITQTKEFRLLMKSRHSLWDELEAEIRKHHSYDIPEIVAVPLSHTSSDYQNWLNEALKR